MNLITLKQLEELSALAEKATPGEWRVHPNPRYYVLLPTHDEGDPNRDNNAAFVAASRAAIPALIATVERLVKELREEHWCSGGWSCSCGRPFDNCDKAALLKEMEK